MDTKTLIPVGILTFVLVTIWITLRLVAYYKTHQANKELWATVFEGMTNKLVDLSPLKLPDVYIEKKVQKNGRDKDASGERPAGDHQSPDINHQQD